MNANPVVQAVAALAVCWAMATVAAMGLTDFGPDDWARGRSDPAAVLASILGR
jgi:hypothetical protein